MRDPKIDRLFAVFCWLGAAMSGFLGAYMLRMTLKFPEIGSFARNTCIAAVLFLIWVAASVWFTVQARRGKKKDR